MSQWTSPYSIQDAAAITPSDTGMLARARGLYVGGAGDVKVRLFPSLKDVTFVALAAGVIHPVSFERVYATGTTATNILALY